jgi:hypothetical protein
MERLFGESGRKWKDNIKNVPEVTVYQNVNLGCFSLDKDKDQWCVLLNTIVNPRFP